MLAQSYTRAKNHRRRASASDGDVRNDISAARRPGESVTRRGPTAEAEVTAEKVTPFRLTSMMRAVHHLPAIATRGPTYRLTPAEQVSSTVRL